MGKTKWQWLALTMYSIGVVANIGAWITLHTWLWNWFMVANLLSWSVVLWCIFFRPVNRDKHAEVTDLGLYDPEAEHDLLNPPKSNVKEK